MANYCSFEIRIKGKRGNALLLCHSIPTMGSRSITYAKGTDDTYEVCLCGSCKWSVNFNVTDAWDGREIDMDLNVLPEAMLEDMGSNLWDYSLRAKSRVLECEVLAHYWSEETGFDHFDHFVNGKRIRKRRIAYDSDNCFDWSALEFIGHEGEINEEETSEANSLLYANRFVRHFDPAAVLSVLQDQDDDVIETSDDDVDEDEAYQKLEELLSKLKQLNANFGIEDDSEDDADEEESFNDDTDEGSETELLDVKEYWLTPDVRFAVPSGFAIEKSTASNGEIDITIKGGQNENDGEGFLLSGVVDVQDIPSEEHALQGQQWIEQLIREENDPEKQYVQLPGNIPALLWSKKLSTFDLLSVKVRPFIVQLQLRASRTQRLDVIIVSSKNENYDRRLFYLALLQMLKGFHVDGKTLNCIDLTEEMLYNKLEPVYEEDLYAELRSDPTTRITTHDWSVSRPVGFCETKSPSLLAQLSDQKLLVPEAFAYTDTLNDIPVKIAIQCDATGLEPDDVNGYIDIHSKQGTIRIAALNYARNMEKTDGHPYQIVTVGNENAGVFILYASSHNTTIARCSLMTQEHLCGMTIISEIDSSAADTFVRSIGHWLSTFEFTHSKWEAEKILLEDTECLKETLQGDFNKFDAAIDQLVHQYHRTVLGGIEYLKHMQLLPGVDINIMKRNANQLLRSAFETKALGVKAASVFLEKLKLHNVSEDALKHVYTKLGDFEPACEGFKIELADDEANNEIELENGTKIAPITHVVLHDTQIVRINEPLSIKAAIAKWKQEANGFNPPNPTPGFMSSLESIQAKQGIEEQNAQLTACIAAHIEANPVIIIPGKKFVFSGLGVVKEEQKNHPIVKELEAKGGLYRSSVSGVTDYLVVGNDYPGEAKLNAAIAQQEKGNPVHIIRLADLEEALSLRQNDACPAVEEITVASVVKDDAVSEICINESGQFVQPRQMADMQTKLIADNKNLTPFERCNARLTEPHLDKLDGVVFSFLYLEDNKEIIDGFLRSHHAIPASDNLVYADYVILHHSALENNENKMNRVLELQDQGSKLQIISDEHLYCQLNKIDKDWADPIHPEEFAEQMTYSAEEVYYYVIPQFCEKYQTFWHLDNNQYWDVAPLRDKSDEDRKKAWSRVWIAKQLPEVQTKLDESLQNMSFEDKYELVQFLYHVYKHDPWKSITQRWKHILTFTKPWFTKEENSIVKARVDVLKQKACESAATSLAAIGMDDCNLETVKTKVFVLSQENQDDPPFGQLSHRQLTVVIESSDGTACIPLTLEHVEYYQADCEDLLKSALARGIVDARMYAPERLTISGEVCSRAFYTVKKAEQIIGTAAAQYPIHYRPDTYGMRAPVCEEDEALLYTIMSLSDAYYSDLEQDLSDLYSAFPGYDDEHLRLLLQVYIVTKDYPERVQRYNEIARGFSPDCWMNRILPFFSKCDGIHKDIPYQYYWMYQRFDSVCGKTDKETLRNLIRKTLQQYRAEEQQKLACQHPQWGDWEQAKHLLTVEDRDIKENSKGKVSARYSESYDYGISEIIDKYHLFACLHAPDGSRKVDVTSMMALGWGVSTQIVLAYAIHNGIYDARNGANVVHKDHKRILANANKCCALLYYTEDQWDLSGECDDCEQRQWFRSMILNDREREEVSKKETEALSAKLSQPLVRGTAHSVSNDEVFEMTYEEVVALFKNYFTQDPDITFEGKRFQLSGIEISTDDSPVVQQVKALGGTVYLSTITREKMDYVIAGTDAHSMLIRHTAIQIDQGEPVHLVHVRDLIIALSLAEEQKKRIEREKRQEEAEQLRQKKEHEEAEQKAAQQQEEARREREEAERKAEEQRKQDKRDQLTTEKNALLQEMNTLTGLFASFKRKKLQARIDELDHQLRRL